MSPVRIDVVTVIDGMDLEEAWPARILFELDGAAVPVVGGDGLVRNEVAAARPQELAYSARLESRE